MSLHLSSGRTVAFRDENTAMVNESLEPMPMDF